MELITLKNDMKKIILVFGTRPEAIKMIPVYKELKRMNDKFNPLICLTGQHKELLDQVMNLFNIKSEFNLNVMKPNQDLFSITKDILIGLKSIFIDEKPDIVLVHGDTTTSFAASLSAFYLNIKVGHIEAGLRSFNPESPFPEEMNRSLISKIAKIHFSPTLKSKENLLNENIGESKIHVTGNTASDALSIILKKISREKLLLSKSCSYKINTKRKLILITGHRRENFGEGFLNICNAIKYLAEKYSDADFVYPMHLNPNVRKPINETFNEKNLKNVFFIEPLDYIDFVILMKYSYLILTDSGGIQEEAPFLGIPVLVMRENTERPEGIESGTSVLVGTNKKKIIKNVSNLLMDKDYHSSFASKENPFGDGNASSRIINVLSKFLS